MTEHPKPHLVLIRAQGLHKLVVEQIQQMIIEGVLAPGTRLNERLLCEKLGVSRTPLREALKILAALGLVELLPNRGAAVVQLTAKDIAETFEVISHLEAMAGELACARITDAEINEIRALHFEMLACHARRDLPAYYRTNQSIHDLINRSARNDVLREMYTTVNSRVKALRFSSNLDRERWDAAVREHSMMIEALEARDGARMASILEGHLLAKRDAALASAAASGEKMGATAKLRSI
ncbi:MAG: GntR family transcriptional regulator [Pseudomonadota bacterium]|nr:GntR family transcriptional regulator [Pseudomonadota bacterium]